MFDDPKRELNRLQRELLAEEEAYGESYEDDDLADILEMLRREDREPPREPVYRNYANGYGADFPREDSYEEEYWDEEDEAQDSRALYRDDLRTTRKVRREKGIRGLVILACLELFGILLILGWWMLWLM